MVGTDQTEAAVAEVTEVTGYVAPGFERISEAFEANFTERNDVGAGFALFLHGELVVDLVGGRTEPGGPEAYGPDRLQMVFSSTKGATAICAHLLAQRGQLDLHAPVVDYWPEFGAHGKADIPVSWLLSHRSGLPDVDRRMTLDEALSWDPVIAALADSVPLWKPGEERGYHAVTYGYLVGEVIRRITGITVGQYFRQEIADPLGLDFWIGLPLDLHDRVVPSIPMTVPPGIHFGDPDVEPPGLIAMLQMLMGGESLIARALSAPGGALTDDLAWNSPALWAAEMPAANGITNARSLAKMYAATVGHVDGVRLLSDATVAHAIEVRSTGPDAVLVSEVPYGLGFQRDAPFATFGSPTAFGHYGFGGSVGFADPAHGIGFGYVTNKMELGMSGDPRSASLIDTAYSSLGHRP